MAVKENLGYWHCGRWVYSSGDLVEEDYNVYIDEDGILRMEECGRFYCQWSDLLPFKYAFGKRFGDEKFLIGVKSDFISRVLKECCGKSEAEVYEIIEKYRGKREAHRNRDSAVQKEWEKLREKFDGVVIGIDSTIDVYGNGFSVRVLFGSDVTFVGRKKFLQENRVEFLKWVISDISKSKKITKRIGDIRFYKPVEIINLRVPEVEVKFEVKGDVA